MFFISMGLQKRTVPDGFWKKRLRFTKIQDRQMASGLLQ
jgi:hypothetical protein